MVDDDSLIGTVGKRNSTIGLTRICMLLITPPLTSEPDKNLYYMPVSGYENAGSAQTLCVGSVEGKWFGETQY